MRFPGFVARLQARRRWRSLTVIALLIGVVGGISTSLIAGSRRSSSVVRRYFDAAIPYDVLVGGQVTRTQLQQIPGVVRADPNTYFASARVNADGSPGAGINSLIYDPVSIDPTIRVLAGTIPEADDTEGVLANEGFLRAFGVHVGSRLTIRTYTDRDLADVEASKYDSPHGPDFRFRIAAVIRTPSDIVLDRVRVEPGSSYGDTGGLFVSDRFYAAHRDEFLTFPDAYDVQLGPSTSLARFESAVKRLGGPDDDAPFFGPPRFAERSASFDTPVGLETTGLLALGIATGLAGAIVVAMLLRAERRVHAHDAELLRALGVTNNQLAVSGALRTAPFAALGTASALGVAYALSSRFPMGVGHLLELDRGFDANIIVLAVAGVLALTLPIAIAFVFERRTRRMRRSTSAAGVRTHRVLARNGAPIDLVIGSNLAFDRGDATRGVPNRPAIAGGAAALALVVALAMFLAGSDRLFRSGDAHGWAWDAVIGNVNFSMTKARETKLLADPRLAAASSARYGQADLDGVSTEILAYNPEGSAPPKMLSGRLPRARDEIAPGAKLLRELHAHVGSTIRLSVANSEFVPASGGRTVERSLTVVGVSIPPVLGESEFGEVAVVPLSAIAAAGGETQPQLVLARIRGNDVVATVRGLARDYTPDIVLDNVPSRVVNLHRVRALPLLGGLLAAVLGAILLAYTLAVSVRVRDRELGVLRALGMTPRRVGRVVIWQGTALALAITAIGLPLGLALGSIVWRVVADQLGVAPRPVITSAIALVIPVSLAIGVAVALTPARRARRLSVTGRLRAE